MTNTTTDGYTTNDSGVMTGDPSYATYSQDYYNMDWHEIEAAIRGASNVPTAGGAVETQAAQAAHATADPGNLWEHGDTFEYVRQVLNMVAVGLQSQAQALAGGYNGEPPPWKGKAADAFLGHMTKFANFVQWHADALRGGMDDTTETVPMRLYDSGNALNVAQYKIALIDYWYGRQAALLGFPPNADGTINVDQVREIPQMMTNDMRTVLLSLAGNYSRTTEVIGSPQAGSTPTQDSTAADTASAPPKAPPMNLNLPAFPKIDIPAPKLNIPSGPQVKIPPLNIGGMQNLLKPPPAGAGGPGGGLPGGLNLGAGGLGGGLSGGLGGGLPGGPGSGLPGQPGGLSGLPGGIGGLSGGAGGLPGGIGGLAGGLGGVAKLPGGVGGLPSGAGGGAGGVAKYPGGLGLPKRAAAGQGAGSPGQALNAVAGPLGAGAGGLVGGAGALGADGMPYMPMMPGMGGAGAGGAQGAERPDASGLLGGMAKPWQESGDGMGEVESAAGAPAGGAGLPGLNPVAEAAAELSAEAALAQGLPLMGGEAVPGQEQHAHAEVSSPDGASLGGPGSPGEAAVAATAPVAPADPAVHHAEPAGQQAPDRVAVVNTAEGFADTSAWDVAAGAAAWLPAALIASRRRLDDHESQTRYATEEAAWADAGQEADPGAPPSDPAMATWKRAAPGTGPVVGMSMLRCVPGSSEAAEEPPPAEPEDSEEEQKKSADTTAGSKLLVEQASWWGAAPGDSGVIR